VLYNFDKIIYNESQEDKMFIYALRDPRDNEIRYIGITNNLSRRLSWHIRKSKTLHRYSSRWIKGLTDAGYSPLIEILETVELQSEAYAAEKRWIQCGIEQGWQLTNHTEGGEGTPGLHWTDKQKQAFSEQKKGSKFTDAHRAALSFAQKERLERGESHVRTGMKHSQETKEKQRNAKLGKKMSNESKQKHSEQSKSSWKDPDIRARRIAGLKAYWDKKRQDKSDATE
jgi:predicted GIY-YIG superfamily endonuclease